MLFCYDTPKRLTEILIMWNYCCLNTSEGFLQILLSMKHIHYTLLGKEMQQYFRSVACTLKYWKAKYLSISLQVSEYIQYFQLERITFSLYVKHWIVHMYHTHILGSLLQITSESQFYIKTRSSIWDGISNSEEMQHNFRSKWKTIYISK